MGKTRRILIVEGDEPFAPPTVPGFTFEFAQSPTAAIEGALAHPPDAVLLSGRVWQDLVGDAFQFWLTHLGVRDNSLVFVVARNRDYTYPMTPFGGGEYYDLVGFGYSTDVFFRQPEDLQQIRRFKDQVWKPWASHDAF